MPGIRSEQQPLVADRILAQQAAEAAEAAAAEAVAAVADISLRITSRGEDALSLGIPTNGVDDASAAIAAIPAQTGRVVLPRGDIRLDHGLVVQEGVTLEGSGWFCSGQPAFGDAAFLDYIHGTRMIFTDPADAGLLMQALSPFRIKDVAIIGPGSGVERGLQVGEAQGLGRARLHDVLLGNWFEGLYGSGMMNSTIADLYALGCTTGVKLRNASNGNTFTGMNIECCGSAIDAQDSTVNSYTGGVVQGNGIGGVPTVKLGVAAHSHIFTGIYFENQPATFSFDLAAGADFNAIIGCHLGYSTTHDAIRIASAQNHIIDPDGVPDLTFLAGSGSNIALGHFNSITDGGVNNVLIDTAGTQFKFGARDLRISSGKRLYFESAGNNSFIGREAATGDTEIGAATGLAKLTAAGKSFRTTPGNTAGRPSAAGFGAGAFYFDTTLNKPIWSDGANWRDAAGNVV